MAACGRAASRNNEEFLSQIALSTTKYGHVLTRCMTYMLNPTTKLRMSILWTILARRSPTLSTTEESLGGTLL